MRLAKTAWLACILATAAAGADAPATHPATQSAAGALLNGKIEFTPPAGWKPVKINLPPESAAAYLADDRDGYLTLQISSVVPDNYSIDSKQIAEKFRLRHKQAGQEIVLTPTIENDARFALKIHERYKLKNGKTADELHLYREIDHRILELDVQSLSDDIVHVDLVHKSAEDMLISAHAKGTDKKGANAPAPQPAPPVATAALLKGKIEFTPPNADWNPVKNTSPELAAVYITDGENSSLFLQILPSDAVVDANAANNILRQIRVNHQKGQEEMILPPTLETDARFSIRVHERFKLKNGKTAEISRMYRKLGGRVLELDVLSLSEDAEHIASLVKTGEDVLISAHWKIPGKKSGK